MSFLLIHIEGCALGEGDAVSCVQIVKTHLAQTDAQPHRHDGSQQFAMLARIERGRRQLIQSAKLLVADDGIAAHLPDKLVGGLVAKPHLQHIADTEPLILSSEEAPRALQP